MVNTGASIAACCLGLAVYASRSIDALRCEVTGKEPPSAVTLMASPSAPKTHAIVLAPDCTYTELKVDALGSLKNDYWTGMFDQVIVSFDRVESVPTSAITLSFMFKDVNNDRLIPGLDLSGATNITRLEISGISSRGPMRRSTMAVDNIKLPPSLESISMYDTPLPASFKDLALPPTLTSLSMAMTEDDVIDVNLLPKFPPNLTELNLGDHKLTTIDFDYPSGLKKLSYYTSALKSLGPLTLPPELEFFNCGFCYNMQVIRGIAWPHTLKEVYLRVWPSVEVEIRQSDVDFFDTVFPFKDISWDREPVATPNCSDETAKIVKVAHVDVCVITDERFNALYGKPVEPPAPSDPSEDSSLSASGSSDGNSPSRSPSSPDEPSGTEERGEHTGRSRPNSAEGGEQQPASQQPVDKSGKTPSDSTPRSPKSSRPGADANQTTDSSSVSPTVIAVAVILSLTVAVALAAIGHRHFFVSRRRDDKGYQSMASPSTEPTEDGSSLSQRTDDAYLDNDIRNDPSILLSYISPDEVRVGALVVRSRQHETLYAEYNSKPVVLKRLSAEAGAADDEAVVARFMDEIRLCSTLDHPKIVAFVGVTWSSRQDITLVSEYMNGGDLSTLLYNQPETASPQDWFEPWTSTKAIKSKAMIARDVVEAMVYLHSFNSPILHRDLKAQNVLVDSQGNAKLSNFGISRELSEEETMTAGVGTVAWIAPEVLRGDRYSEKADIYSFGVLLVELDRCRHPYAEKNVSDTTEGGQMTSSQIAMAVVSGQLRPSATDVSPAWLKEMVAKCVSFEPGDRPTAMAVHFALRRMHGAHE